MFAVGSSEFIKRRFGLGFYLNIYRTDQQINNPQAIINCVVNRYGGSQVREIQNKSISMSFSLPAQKESEFGNLISEINQINTNIQVSFFKKKKSVKSLNED